LHPHVTIRTKLPFHPDRISDRGTLSFEGTVAFRPYSNGDACSVQIRVATIHPGRGGALDCFVYVRVNSQARWPGRAVGLHLPPWPGFQSVFGPCTCHGGRVGAVTVNLMHRSKMILKGDPTTIVLAGAAATHNSRVSMWSAIRFDVLFVYIPARWGAGFRRKRRVRTSNLHDQLKAFVRRAG